MTKKARETQEAACKKVEEADGWTTEISLDIEVSHAVCQNCKIVLVEADSASFFDLETAENAAAGLRATEISNSWGGAECSKGIRDIECGEDSEAFNHPGIVITAAAGDDGYLDWDAEEGAEKGFADYPASSPHVVAVGGTRLRPLGPEGTWRRRDRVERRRRRRRRLQHLLRRSGLAAEHLRTGRAVGCGTGRAVADVSADADPYTGVAIYDSDSRKRIRRKRARSGPGARSAAPASPHRSSPRCSRSPGARTASNTPRRPCTKMRSKTRQRFTT